MKRDTERIQKLLGDNEDQRVYSTRFNLHLKQSDEEFDKLNNLIDRAADQNPGFLGKERWTNGDENKISVIYYWENLEALEAFSNNPDHKYAKRNYKKWYHGFEVIVSEVLDFRSDGGF